MDAAEVFEVIATHLAARSQDLAVLAETGYSFEEWLNWEAYLACVREGWKPQPRPAYRSLMEPGASREFRDLLVGEASGRPLLIETAVLHDETSDKWIQKIDWDSDKLRRAAETGVAGLQLVVAASKGRISNNPKWQEWLARTVLWRMLPTMSRTFDLELKGELSIWGWEVTAFAANS